MARAWVSGRMRYESPGVGATGASRGARSAHVVVIANEKGGSGKTTTAMHVVVALLKAGQKVACIDVDSRQRSLTRYVANRRLWARKRGVPLELPDHHAVDRAGGRNVDENEAAEFAAFAAAITAVEHSHDFVVIDTPATDSRRRRITVSPTVRSSIPLCRSDVSDRNRISPMIDEIGARIGRSTSGGSEPETKLSFSLTTWRAA